ncbi:MAG: hypothetical protein HYT62_02540 [Candidatus Yanofskybacteria bacterium]|nr:hypothetical protein [Candidatus Yanofskybacteria bacterium]
MKRALMVLVLATGGIVAVSATNDPPAVELRTGGRYAGSTPRAYTTRIHVILAHHPDNDWVSVECEGPVVVASSRELVSFERDIKKEDYPVRIHTSAVYEPGSPFFFDLPGGIYTCTGEVTRRGDDKTYVSIPLTFNVVK